MVIHNAWSFAKSGWETHLCLGEGEPSDTQTELEQFYGIPADPQLNIHRIARLNAVLRSDSASVYQYAYRLALRLIKDDNLLVIARDHGFLSRLARLCRSPRVIGLFELHDFYARMYWREKVPLTHRRIQLIEHLFVRKISGLICLTADQQELYRKQFPHVPSTVSPLGTLQFNGSFDPDVLKMRWKRRTLIYVGHLQESKGLGLIKQAAARLGDAGIKIEILGGDPNKAGRFQKRFLRAGAQNVNVTPIQAPEKMHRTLAKQATAGLALLTDSFYNRYLTCPVKVLDYLSHGLPALASDLPSVRALLEDTGVYIRSIDSDEFVRQALALFDQYTSYEARCLAVQSRCEALLWPKRAADIVLFAESLSRRQ